MEVSIDNIPTGELTPHPDNLRIYGENPYVWDIVTSIKEHGLLRPIIIDQDKRIIDGVRRWTASKNLELETVPCETRAFPDKDSAISARACVKRIETEKARKRQEATRFGPGRAQGHAEVGSTEGNVRDIVASYFKMGRTKFNELEKIFESEDVYPEIAEKVDDGTWSVHRGYAKIRDTVKKQKDVEDMKTKISEALSHVKRESLREALEEKYLSDESDLSKTSIKAVRIEIDKELGLPVGPTDLEQWKEIKEKFLKMVNLYKEHSSSREWSSEDRRFLQTVTWMDVGKNIPNLNRTEHPEERFSSYEEADAYAETLGGYCTGLHKIGTKTVWILLVRQE